MNSLLGRVSVSFVFFTFSAPYSYSQSISTGQFDNFRTGANTSEQTLNPTNVNASSFGRKYTLLVDGQIFAQPLYVKVAKPRGNSGKPANTINTLYVATMNNSIYAFNADTGQSIFHINLGAPVPLGWAGTCPYQGTGMNQLGILSTPVVDTQAGMLYAVAATPSGGSAGAGTYVHRLFAIDMRTGAIKKSVSISATIPGTADDQVNGQVSMNQTRYIQRPALLLSNGKVYAGFGSCGPDPDPYHGWVLGYDASTLAQTAVYNASSDSMRNAIWQAGRGLVGDSSGYVYLSTGNGKYDGTTQLSDSVIKINGSGGLTDWFTPANHAMLDAQDLDLSSSGPLLMPDSNLLVAGGKEGVLYILNPKNLGHANQPGQSQRVQVGSCNYDFGGHTCNQIHSIAYWAGHLFVWANNNPLQGYTIAGGSFISATPYSQSALTTGYPGGFLAVSANGTSNGIVWATTSDFFVRAFDARNLSNPIWSDPLPSYAKFVSPVIADGKLFVATWANGSNPGSIIVYGLF